MGEDHHCENPRYTCTFSRTIRWWCSCQWILLPWSMCSAFNYFAYMNQHNPYMVNLATPQTSVHQCRLNVFPSIVVHSRLLREMVASSISGANFYIQGQQRNSFGQYCSTCYSAAQTRYSLWWSYQQWYTTWTGQRNKHSCWQSLILWSNLWYCEIVNAHQPMYLAADLKDKPILHGQLWNGFGTKGGSS